MSSSMSIVCYQAQTEKENAVYLASLAGLEFMMMVMKLQSIGVLWFLQAW
jgi:hypothetical protein